MSETDKNNKPDIKKNSSPEKGSKEKEDVQPITICKAESHKDNKCILEGIDKQRLKDFNDMKIITVSIEELKINGAKFNDKGECIHIPYRWMGVE